MLGKEVAVGFFGVNYSAFAGQVASAGHRALARCVGKQLVRRGRPHGGDEYSCDTTNS